MMGHNIYLVESLCTLDKMMIVNYLTNNSSPIKAHLFLATEVFTSALPFKSVTACTHTHPTQECQSDLKIAFHLFSLFSFYIISPPNFLIWRVVLILWDPRKNMSLSLRKCSN